MKQYLAVTCILAGAMIAGGCATKKYVRQNTAPIQAKVDQVGDQTTKQGQTLEETRARVQQVDENAQSGINAAKERAATADTHAQEAMNKANQAASTAEQNGKDINGLRQNLGQMSQTIANLDDYKPVAEAMVNFGFNKYLLTDQAKADLDQMVASHGSMKRYFIAVEGFTDKTGSKEYNAALSRRRADAVVQYLVTKHDIPIYRIHMIGLGSDKPAVEGHTRADRAKNRRVEVRIYSADQGATVSQLQNQR